MVLEIVNTPQRWAGEKKYVLQPLNLQQTTKRHIEVSWRSMRKFPKLIDQFCWLTQKRFSGDTLEWTEFVLAPGDEATEINRYFWEIVRLEPSSTSRRSRVILTSRSPGTWWILERKEKVLPPSKKSFETLIANGHFGVDRHFWNLNFLTWSLAQNGTVHLVWDH